MTNKEKYQNLYLNSWCEWNPIEPPSRQYAIYVGQKGAAQIASSLPSCKIYL
jgi:hypothetical protein